MVDDWVAQFVREQNLPTRLTQISTEKGLAYVETMIDRLVGW